MKALARELRTYNKNQFACNCDTLRISNPQDKWHSFQPSISHYRSRHKYRATS